MHYQSHLLETELFHEDVDTFRINLMTRKDHMCLVDHLYDIALINLTGAMTTDPHDNTGLVDNFKVSYSPDDSFKSLSK